MVNLLTIKNSFKIHILFYFAAFIAFVTGYFKNFIIFTLIIIVHEFGHILAALFFKWKIEKVIILPFGGITIFNEDIDKSLVEEFIIAISGPIFQIVLYLIFKDNYLFNLYNKIILVFNLIPIYPLDGSKILNVILNKFISFKTSHLITIYISLILIFIIILNNLNLMLFLIFIFLIKGVIIDYKKHKYYINKFFIEKLIHKKEYKNKKIINNIYKMKKQTNHLVRYKNKYYKDIEIIRNLFDK